MEEMNILCSQTNVDREFHDLGLVKLHRRRKKGVLLMPCSFTTVMLEWFKGVKVCPLDNDGVHIVGANLFVVRLQRFSS